MFHGGPAIAKRGQWSIFKVISNNESTKRIVHEKHERHERILLLFVLFVSFVDSISFLRIRFFMGCSFLGIT